MDELRRINRGLWTFIGLAFLVLWVLNTIHAMG